MALNISPDIIDFLKTHHVAVLATSSQTAVPAAAAIFYTTDSHANIYFLTKDNTSKSKNLDANPQAALVIYEAETLRTAQISGNVARVQNEEMMQKALRIMSRFSERVSGSETTPISKLDAGEYVLYCLTPQAIRLGDYKYGGKGTIFDIATPAEESLED